MLTSIVAYNLVVQFRRQAAKLADVAPRRLSFTGVWNTFDSFLLTQPPPQRAAVDRAIRSGPEDCRSRQAAQSPRPKLPSPRTPPSPKIDKVHEATSQSQRKAPSRKTKVSAIGLSPSAKFLRRFAAENCATSKVSSWVRTETPESRSRTRDQLRRRWWLSLSIVACGQPIAVCFLEISRRFRAPHSQLFRFGSCEPRTTSIRLDSGAGHCPGACPRQTPSGTTKGAIMKRTQFANRPSHRD